MRNTIETGTSALSPAPVTVTEQVAAAILPVAPTAEQQAEAAAEQAEEAAELEAAADLSDFAGRSAARSVAIVDRAGFRAIVAASLSLIFANSGRTLSGREEAPNLDDFAMNSIFSAMAQSGVMVHRNKSETERDSEAEVDAIRATVDPVARAKRAAAYVKTFGTGRKMTDAAANLQTDAGRLARFFRDSEAGRNVIRDVDALKADHAKAFRTFRDEVHAATGCTGKGALVEFLRAQFGKPSAKARKAKAAATVAAHPAPSADTVKLPAPAPAPVVETRTVIVEKAPDLSTMTVEARMSAILEMAATLDDSDLAALYQRLGAERDARREAREAAALEAMREAADAAARDAAAKAEQVMTVEAVLSVKPARKPRPILMLPAPREAVAA